METEKERTKFMLDLAEKYKKVYEERGALINDLKVLEDNVAELMGYLIGIVWQSGGAFILKTEHVPRIDVRDYRLKWVHMPEEEGIRLEVKHYIDNE